MCTRIFKKTANIRAFTICFLFMQSLSLHAQKIEDGVSIYSDEDKYLPFINFQVSTSATINKLDGSDNFFYSFPVNFRMILSPLTHLKGESNAVTAAFIANPFSENYGVGVILNYGLRYDDTLSSSFHYAARIGMQQNTSIFHQEQFIQLRPDFYLDLIQGFSLTRDIDLVANQGILYIPTYKKLIPTFILGFRLGKIFTFGADISSFFLNREDNFLKMRGLF